MRCSLKHECQGVSLLRTMTVLTLYLGRIIRKDDEGGWFEIRKSGRVTLQDDDGFQLFKNQKTTPCHP